MSTSYASSCTSWMRAANQVFSDSKYASQTLSQCLSLTRVTSAFVWNLSKLHSCIMVFFNASRICSISSMLYLFEHESFTVVMTFSTEPVAPKEFLHKSSSSYFFRSTAFSAWTNWLRSFVTLSRRSEINLISFSSTNLFSRLISLAGTPLTPLPLSKLS